MFFKSRIYPGQVRGGLFSRKTQATCIGRVTELPLSRRQVGGPRSPCGSHSPPNCWQQIDSSNVTGTRTCGLLSRRQITPTFKKHACCLCLCLFCGWPYRTRRLPGSCRLDDQPAGPAGRPACPGPRDARARSQGPVLSFSSSLPSAHKHPWCCLIWESLGPLPLTWSRGIRKWEEILLSFKNQEQMISSIPEVFEKKKILSIRGIRELYTMAEMMYTSTGLMCISVYEFVRTH